jgi:hypothetical protein
MLVFIDHAVSTLNNLVFSLFLDHDHQTVQLFVASIVVNIQALAIVVSPTYISSRDYNCCQHPSRHHKQPIIGSVHYFLCGMETR